MASVNKLSIRGVRSFSPEDAEQVVEFYFPITIIVGANGCGKTTIIESLKYAVSGAFPPGNRSGQAFVHDPKSIGLNTVKANVKLRFTSRSGQTMVCVRSMEVTQKKGSLAFKQLDGVLRMMDQDTGQRVSLSHKCSELDKQLPSLLGVSKAILEHVIFCHQEDASWPLMEGAVLKKRFDEIFDSTRYTKAIEVFRKTEKDMLNKVKELKTDLASLASHKHAAQGYKKDLSEQNDQIELLDDEKKRINEGVAETEQEIAGAYEIINQMEDIEGQIECVKNELDRTASVADARRKMLEQDLTRTHTIQHLNDMLRDFDEKMVAEVDKKDQLEREFAVVEQKIESLREEEKKLSSRIGKNAAEKEAHENRVKERYTNMESISQTFSVDLRSTLTQDTFVASMTPRASPSQTTVGASQEDAVTIAPEDMQCFFQALQKKEDGLKADLVSKKERLQSQEDDLQVVLTEIGGKLKAIESECAKLDTQRSEAQREHQELSKDNSGHSRLRKSDVDEARKSADDFAKRYEQLNSDPRRNEIPIEIRREEDKIDKLKRQIEDDRMHLDTLRHSAEAQNTISVLKSQCTRDLEALHESLREQSYELQKHNLQPTGQLPGANGEDDNGDQLVAYVETLVDEVQNKYDAADTEVTRVQEALDRAQKTVSEKTALLKSRQQSSASLRAKLDSLSGNNGPIAKVGNVIEELRKHGTDPAVLNVLGDDKGPRVILNHLDEQLELIEESDPSSVGTPAVVRKVLNKLKKLATVPSNESPLGIKMECPCCSREMGNGELEEFSRSMNALLDEDTSKLLKVDQAAVEQYRNDKSTYQRWRKVIADNMDDVRDFRRMTDESTEAETATERLQADLTHHQAKANDQKELLAESQPVADELRALVDAAKRWSEDANRIADKKIEINQKHADLSASTAHTGRDLRTVEREMAEKMEDKDNLTNKINKLNKEMSSLNNLLSQLSSQVTRTNKVAIDKEAKYAAEQKATVKREELSKLLENIGRDEKKLKDQTTPLAQKKKKKEADKLRLRAVANEEEQSLRATIDQFSLDVKYLRDLTRQIDDYSRSNKADELDQVASQASKVLERIEQQKKALSSLQPEVDSVRAAVNDQERHKKQLKENVELLHAEQRTNELQEEIDDLETKLKNVDGQETCYAKHTEAKARKEQQLASKARTEGRWSEIVEQIRSLKRKLSTPEYKGVDERYRVAMIKHETTQIAADDLKKYYGALDKALLKFHSVKIAEINKIIRELWLFTYKGEDIDNIELVSGQEPGSRASKSYNYRVVMTKGSSQMDMRGRCSAGQRVLASTVIRFALAETFGVNCGCIALDEPTVNLDYRNKKGLAIALAQIVGSRAQQANFQLILITHDEEFVGMMKAELSAQTGFSMPEKYFQVRREAAPDGKYYSKIDAIDWDELV